MEKPNWERQQSSEEIFDDKVRQIMYTRNITYQEAADLVKNGQKSISEF